MLVCFELGRTLYSRHVGLLAGLVCLWGVNGLKRLLGADDSLDVFGVHGVGGILGAMLTGVFASPARGGTGIAGWFGKLPGCEPAPYIIRFTSNGIALGFIIFARRGSFITFALTRSR